MKVLPRNRVLLGDAATVLAGLLPESVDAAVTSPPYAAGLRDYGHADQLGREPDVDEYIARLMQVLRGVHRVLKPTGSLWLSLGDSYSRRSGGQVPAKSLLLVPQRAALALAADGWLIRNVCVWHKSNPLPQSATDRLSPTYEVVIFATKQANYFFDLDSVREPHRSVQRAPRPGELTRRYRGGNAGLGALKARGLVGNPRGKNPGDLVTLPTAVDRLGHEATFPEALIERPIACSVPEKICVECDAAWTRPTRVLSIHTSEGVRHVRKVGDLRRCECRAPTRRGIVLDPFMGTGTVGVVAERMGRDWLGVELNPAYARMAEQRIVDRRAA